MRSLKDRKKYIGQRVTATVDMGSTAKAGETFTITEKLVERYDPYYWFGNGSVVAAEEPPKAATASSGKDKQSKSDKATKAGGGLSGGSSDGN